MEDGLRRLEIRLEVVPDQRDQREGRPLALRRLVPVRGQRRPQGHAGRRRCRRTSTVPPTATVPPTSTVPPAADAYGAELMRLINLDRAALNLPALSIDAGLASIARDAPFTCPTSQSMVIRGRAQDMADRSYFAHTVAGCNLAGTTTPYPSLTIVRSVFGYALARSEILHWNKSGPAPATYALGCDINGNACTGGTTRAPATVSIAQRNFMSSSPHRTSELGSFERFGCGSATVPGTTTTYFACIFSDSGSSLDAGNPADRDADAGRVQRPRPARRQSVPPVARAGGDPADGSGVRQREHPGRRLDDLLDRDDARSDGRGHGRRDRARLGLEHRLLRPRQPAPPGTSSARSTASPCRPPMASLPLFAATGVLAPAPAVAPTPAPGTVPGAPGTPPTTAPGAGPVTLGPSVTFYGRGTGHGVGLSQYGARGRALAGQDAPTILAHYYPGTTIGLMPPAPPIRVLLLSGAPFATDSPLDRVRQGRHVVDRRQSCASSRRMPASA